MIRILLYAIAALAILLLLAVGALFTVDLGSLKGPAQEWLSDFLEREIAVDGELVVHLGRDIRISGRDFRLAAPDWSAHPNMVEADQIEGRVRLRSLLNWPIQIHAVRATGVRVYLEDREDGPANWVFWPDEPAVPDDDKRFTWPIMLDDTQLRDVLLNYLSPGSESPLVIQADRLQEELINDGIEAELSGRLNQTPLRLALRGETVAEIVQMRKTRFSWDGSLGEVNFKGNMALEDLLNPARPTAELELKGPSVEYLTDRLGMDRISSGPLALDFTIAPAGERMQATADGRFGEFVVLSSAQFANLQRLSNVDLRLSASGPSAAHVGNLAGVQGIPDQPFSINTQLQRRDAMLDVERARITVGETQFDLAGRVEDLHRPGSMSATLDIAGPDLGTFGILLGMPGKLTGAFDVEVDVEPGDGGAEFTGIMHSSLATVQASGHLSREEKLVGSHFNLRATMDSVADLAQLLESPPALPATAAVLVADVTVTDQGYVIQSSELQMAEDRLNVSGLVGPAPDLAGTALDVGIHLPQPRKTLQAFGIGNDNIPDGALRLEGYIERQPASWQLRNMRARYGTLTAEAGAELTSLESLDGASATLLVSGPDLAAQLPDAPFLAGLGHAFRLSGAARITGANLDLEGRFDIDRTHLEGNASIPLGDQASGGSFDLRGESPDLLALAPSPEQIQSGQTAPLSVVAQGSWQSNLFRFSNIDLELGESRLQIQGDLEGPPNFERTDLTMEATIPDLSRLSPLVGWALPQHRTEASFQLDGTANVVSLTDLVLRSGKTDISGSAALRSGEIPDITVNLQSQLLDLTQYLPDPESEDTETASPAEPTAESIEKDGRFIPDTPIDISGLEQFSGKFDISVGELVVGHRSISQVVLDASVQQGALRVARAAYIGEDDGKLEALGSIRPSPDGARLALRARGRNMNIGLPALTSDDLEQLPRYEVKLALLASGSTLREMAAKSNGYVELLSGPGKVRTGALQMFTDDFLDQLISTLNPFEDKNPYNDIECITLLAGIEQGQLAGSPLLVINSKRLNIFSYAQVNLATEQLAVTFRTVPQRGLGLSLSNLVNPYVQVTGTLDSPKLSLDPEGTILQGGAAVATGGLSIIAIGLKDRFFSSKTPCEDALKAAEEQFNELERRYGGTGTAQDTPEAAPAAR